MSEHVAGYETKRTRAASAVFTARRNASAVYTVIMCPSVRLSVRHKPILYRNDWSNRTDVWHRGLLPPMPRCVKRKIGYLQKLGYFPVQLFSPNLRLKIATASRSRSQQHSSSSSSTVKFVDETYTTVDESRLFNTSPSTVTLWLHSICCA